MPVDLHAHVEHDALPRHLQRRRLQKLEQELADAGEGGVVAAVEEDGVRRARVEADRVLVAIGDPVTSGQPVIELRQRGWYNASLEYRTLARIEQSISRWSVPPNL